MSRFTGKLAIVTGSSSGIGYATACLLISHGASVVINGRDASELAAAAEGLNARPGSSQEVTGVVGDITEAGVAEALAEAALAYTGRIDVLVNNVGGASAALPLTEVTAKELSESHSRNVASVFAALGAVVPYMRAAQAGRIVNVASLAGRAPSVVADTAYAAHKAAVIGLTRQAAFELAKDGIAVNCVAPGLIATERVVDRVRHEGSYAAALVSTPLRRAGRPEEVASAICFLASAEASYITGVTLDVNGGRFM